MPLTPKEAAAQLLQRRLFAENLTEWATFVVAQKGQVPALHHRLMLTKLQEAVDGTLRHSKTGDPCRRLIIRLPPGSAKSTYSSVIFPSWFVQRRPHSNVLACSYAASLIESFSQECRNLIDAHSNMLGISLREDSQAVKGWATSNGSKYRCVGVGGGIAGYRADLTIIDDYIGSEEDADSQIVRDKQWAWLKTDVFPRLKPGAIQVIVANRRHEDDLIGRILAKEAHRWEDIKIPFFAKEGDVLGRPVGARLWPEWFTEEMATDIMALPPRTRACLYDQEPTPDEGNYFLKDWMRTYTRDDYDRLMKREKDLHVFGAGDWAVSTEEGSNRTCFGAAVLDDDGLLYILPDLFWKVADPREVVTAFVDLLKRRNPLQFWSEKGHISKAWGPFLREQMLDQQVYSYITEVVPSKAKDVRAQSIRGRMSMHRVRFPEFATWWPDAMREMLMFPGGKTDDFVDFIAHLGAGINSMVRPNAQRRPTPTGMGAPVPITLDWVKRSDAERKKDPVRYGGR